MFPSIASRSPDDEPFHITFCVRSPVSVLQETCFRPIPAKHAESPGAPFPAASPLMMLLNFLVPRLPRFGVPAHDPLPRLRFLPWRRKLLTARSDFRDHVHCPASSWQQAV